jgi:hypothetical protein
MNLFYPLVLIAPPLQVSSFAGYGQVSALPAQPELQTLPVSETHGAVQGDWLGIAATEAGEVDGDARSARMYKAGHNSKTTGTL